MEPLSFLSRRYSQGTLLCLFFLFALQFIHLSVAIADPTLEFPVDEPEQWREGEFSFVRLQYDTRYASRRSMGMWSTDFPAADINFLKGVTRLTNVKVNQEPIVLRLDDQQIFSHPFIYAVEMGRNGGVFFSPEEINNLREYLLRGGFMLIDDFWGTYQWDAFYQMFSLVFPDREIIKLDSSHEIFHGFYDVEGAQMIPALSNYDNRPEGDVEYASNHAILDDNGRVMVLINWNSDMGDGWEHTYHREYPVKYANLSYQLGINYLIYALTH
ncbi:DUF4159 domain-containing protein [Aurantivibrio plasticivorans]